MFWGEWKRIFVCGCSKHLLLAASEDRVVGQAGCFVWVGFVISVGLNSQPDPLWWFFNVILQTERLQGAVPEEKSVTNTILKDAKLLCNLRSPTELGAFSLIVR